MEVSIERSDCISCGLCVSTCPDVFRIAEDGLAEVYRQPGPAHLPAVKSAAGAARSASSIWRSDGSSTTRGRCQWQRPLAVLL